VVCFKRGLNENKEPEIERANMIQQCSGKAIITAVRLGEGGGCWQENSLRDYGSISGGKSR
jgi:hypothetical protein